MTTTHTTVTSLVADVELSYSLPAFMAVIAAFEQQVKGNYNTWEYDYSTDRLRKLAVSADFVACGDYCARLDDESREVLADIAKPDKPAVIVEYLGIENDQYFQGYGTSYTPFTDCVTGSGYSFREALDDAIEQVAQVVGSADFKTLEPAILAYVKDNFRKNFNPKVRSGMDAYAYVGISWKL